MTNITYLKYPKKSHRKEVILPKYSAKLAEFFGIMIGDGGINNLWQITISLNSIKDIKYGSYVFNLCNTLFNIFPAIRKRKSSNTLVISLASISIVDFLVSEGLSRGNKLKNGLDIPEWILNNKSYRKACVRGLVDTDGCVFIHTHRVKGKIYKNISLTFTSLSPKLIFRVTEILAEFGILAHIDNKGENIYLYRIDAVVKYLKVFGTSNERISSVYKKWRDARVV